jgi:hypothetical protein
LLRSPAVLVNAIRYVLENAARHYGRVVTADAFSSEAEENAGVLARPSGWLPRSGWLRAPSRLLERLRNSARYRDQR